MSMSSVFGTGNALRLRNIKVAIAIRIESANFNHTAHRSANERSAQRRAILAFANRGATRP
jgi:hypothetical protein